MVITDFRLKIDAFAIRNVDSQRRGSHNMPHTEYPVVRTIIIESERVLVRGYRATVDAGHGELEQTVPHSRSYGFSPPSERGGLAALYGDGVRRCTSRKKGM